MLRQGSSAWVSHSGKELSARSGLRTPTSSPRWCDLLPASALHLWGLALVSLQVCETVNGPLMERLAGRCSFHDACCVDTLRHGAGIVKRLPCSGNGKPLEGVRECDVSSLLEKRAATNAQILSKLRADVHAEDLLKMTIADAELGRMSWPRPISEADMHLANMSPRFCIEQGLKPDGTPKLRAVDDFSKSLVNECVVASEKLKYDTLDALLVTMRDMKSNSSAPLELFKIDIDSAYRRVPLKFEERQFAAVVFKVGDVSYIAEHYALPFGSLGSVHGWDRIGALLRFLGRKLLKLPLHRFVDDFMGAERQGSAKIATETFVRLVKACLGNSSVAQRKVEWGNPLTVLGVRVSLTSSGAQFVPDDVKVAKWLARINKALSEKKLTCGEASKLSGALQWASQYIFKRLGRAMLRPLIEHTYGRGFWRVRLEHCLEWWKQVLELKISQERARHGSVQKPFHLSADARSTPPRLAAVLICDGKFYYTEMAPPKELLEVLVKRNDNQIMGLEIMSIALGISSFSELIKSRKVRVWSDNKGAEGCTRKGAAKSFDHNSLIHAFWLRAAQLRLEVFISRVPTKDNIADDPSRER